MTDTPSKQIPTEYVIFGSTDGQTWTALGRTKAVGQEAAIGGMVERHAADPSDRGFTQFAAAPARSWRPVKAVSETVVKTKLVSTTPAPPPHPAQTSLATP